MAAGGRSARKGGREHRACGAHAARHAAVATKSNLTKLLQSVKKFAQGCTAALVGPASGQGQGYDTTIMQHSSQRRPRALRCSIASA